MGVLSPREYRIGKYLAEGKDDEHIAELTKSAPSTVRNHIWSAYRKLGVRSRQDLANAIKNGDVHEKHTVRPAAEILSTRELAVAKLWAKGKKDHAIAKMLNISYFTVRRYRQNAYQKTGVSSMRDLLKKLGLEVN
jgi:DNA-binding NarL/FixJ family response regulator